MGHPRKKKTKKMNIEIALLQLKKPIKDLTLIIVYKSPRVPVKVLLDEMEKTEKELQTQNRLIFMGDFNINWSAEKILTKD